MRFFPVYNSLRGFSSHRQQQQAKHERVPLVVEMRRRGPLGEQSGPGRRVAGAADDGLAAAAQLHRASTLAALGG